MKHDIVDGFVIVRHYQGQWTVQPTKLFSGYEEAREWTVQVALAGDKVIVPIKAVVTLEEKL